MGSNNSRAESLSYEPKDWQQTQRAVVYEVMRNSRGEQAQLYHFNIKGDRELDDEVDIYLRRKSPANWVQVLGANLTKSGFGFCGTQQNACVLTEAIPVLLGSVSRLNRQQSAVVLYNALRGYSDLTRLVVPGTITAYMIGFNRAGQTKVWVNENFGMNHPVNQSVDAHLDEVAVLNSLVDAVSPRLDLTPQLLTGVRNSRTIADAVGFVRANSGVDANILESNRINISGLTQQTSTILNSNTVVQPVQPVVTSVQPTVYTSNVVVPPPVYRPLTQVLSSGYINRNVNFVYGSTVVVDQPAGQNKYSFTNPQ